MNPQIGRQERFEAYLDRKNLCQGGTALPLWSADGAHFFASGKVGWRRIEIFSGASEAWPELPALAAPSEAAETWIRGGYIGEVPTHEVPSPDGRWYASIRDGDIVLRSSRDGRHRAITDNGSTDLAWDIEAPRGRLLPGLEASMVSISPWCPDSRALFACRRDISGVFRIPRIFWLNDFEEVDFTPFEKAGARIDRYHPYIVDIRGGASPIDIGDVEDCYVQLLGWRPDGREVLVIAYSRDMTEARIVAADRQSGAARTLMTEKGATFIRLQHETLMSAAHGLAFLPDSSGFLWLSTRDGWNHIYRYDEDGHLIGQLTSGAWPVQDIEHVGMDSFVYFTASPDRDRPYDVHVCRVPLIGGPIERLTEARGIHRPTFAPNGGSFLDASSAVDRPLSTELRRADGTHVTTVATMDISPLEAIGYCAPEEFTTKAADGVTELWGVIYKPTDFDPCQSYPVIEHVYGGPQVVATARHFPVFEKAARNLPWALAQLGFVVVSLDARGTPGRSKAFQDVIYRQWGQNEISDHAAAIRQLCDRNSWMDADRVGIIGHSWGGYFSTAALVQAPEVYKVAVSSSPGYIPWESILYEPYLGLPAHDAAAYDRADLTRYAADLKGNLLLVAGTSEYGPISDAMKMSRALIDAGVQHEFAVLPGEYHSYTGAAERYFITKATDFLLRHLMPGRA